MERKPVVVVSSTSLDVPTYRAKAIEACRRLGFDTSEMELLTAESPPPVDVSKRLVDTADVYLGIYAHRYGTIPAGETRSITEMEFDWAVARDIPRLLFVMHPEHPWPTHLIEFANYPKLEAFKARISRPGNAPARTPSSALSCAPA